MTAGGWRRACLACAALSAVLAWRSCTRPSAATPTPDACATLALDDERARDRDDRRPSPRARAGRDDDGRVRGDQARAPDDPAADDGPAWSVSAPAWVLWLAPQPGEDLLHYRDRMVPLAQAAVAPHRARVARGRDAFAAAVGLDTAQRAELDAAVADAADAIQARAYDAALSGELLPARFKPMAAVALGRDVLDAVDRANLRFLATLRPEQRAALARHPFDLADYLLFSTRWEDALGYTE